MAGGDEKKMKSYTDDGMTMLTDAHAHMGDEPELQERIRCQIPTLLCAGNPQEAKRLEGIVAEAGDGAGTILIPTYGLHPWQADEKKLEAMLPYLERCQIIGELGMDSVWCDVPLDLQRRVFERQLQLAAEKQKAVILHTKGQEKEIAAMIEKYPNTYLVHWYSAADHLDRYLALDCYVSIGPDVWWNPIVQTVAKQVPIERLLVETDGMGAVRWAYEEAGNDGMRSCPASVAEALQSTIQTVAELRIVDEEWLTRQINQNFWGFLGL